MRLVDAEVVSNTASTIINGNDTNNIAVTRRNPKRRLSDHQRKAVFAAMSVPVLWGGWGGFHVTPGTGDGAKDFVAKQPQSSALRDRQAGEPNRRPERGRLGVEMAQHASPDENYLNARPQGKAAPPFRLRSNVDNAACAMKLRVPSVRMHILGPLCSCVVYPL